MHSTDQRKGGATCTLLNKRGGGGGICTLLNKAEPGGWEGCNLHSANQKGRMRSTDQSRRGGGAISTPLTKAELWAVGAIYTVLTKAELWAVGAIYTLLTKAEEVGRQAFLIQIVVSAVQHLQLWTRSKATWQVVQLVHTEKYILH